MSNEQVKHIKKLLSILRIIAIATIVLLIYGFLIDIFSGFYVLKNSKSIYSALVCLFLLAIFYLIGEAGGNWIGSKDNVSHLLYKRLFHLVLLLMYAGIIITAAWFILNYFVFMKIINYTSSKTPCNLFHFHERRKFLQSISDIIKYICLELSQTLSFNLCIASFGAIFI